MKETVKISCSKAFIELDENGEFILYEKTKDEVKVFNLTNKLKEYVGIDGVSLSLSKDEDLDSEE